MNKPEAIREARQLAKRLDTDVYVIQGEPPFGCAVLTQTDYDDLPFGWVHDGDIIAVYDEMGCCD